MGKCDLATALNTGTLVFDGGFGTELYRKNYFVNTSYDTLVLTDPAVVSSIHQAYVDAGADVLTTNTYSANRLSLARFGLAEKVNEINCAAVALAKKAAAGRENILIAGSIGPVSGDDAALRTGAIAEQASALIGSGADFLIFESISNISDLQDILQAMQKVDFPWMPSFVFDSNGKMADGSDFQTVLAELDDLRQNFLLSSIKKGTQTIITSVDTLHFKDEYLKDVEIFKISNNP